MLLFVVWDGILFRLRRKSLDLSVEQVDLPPPRMECKQIYIYIHMVKKDGGWGVKWKRGTHVRIVRYIIHAGLEDLQNALSLHNL